MASSFIPLGDIHPAAWHQERALGVGGSEASSLFNEGFGCFRRLIYEKRGVPADYRNTRETELLFRRGNRLEDMVASEFTEATGLKVRKQPSRVSKTHEHARVNMDRQIVAVDAKHLYELTKDEHGFSPLADILNQPGPGALECKTMNTFDFRDIEKNGLTKHNHYILQLMHTMAVTGYKWGVFAILDTTSFKLLWFPMIRIDALCQETLDRSEAAWHLVMDTSLDLPAKLPDGDKRCGKCLWRRTCRGDEYLVQFAGADFATDYVETLDPEMIEWATDYVTADEQADKAREVADAIKVRIKARMGADNTNKVKVPDVIRFCFSEVKGRKGWDGKAIEGEVNALRKGETIIDTAAFTPEQLEAAQPVVAALLPAIANRIANCQKVGAPSTMFRTYAV